MHHALCISLAATAATNQNRNSQLKRVKTLIYFDGHFNQSVSDLHIYRSKFYARMINLPVDGTKLVLKDSFY